MNNVCSSVFGKGNSRKFPTTDGDEPVIPSVMDLPCKTASLQWWYANAHLRSLNGEKDFSFFSSFFRQKRGEKDDGSCFFSDACTWALIDVLEEKYYPDSLLDHNASKIIIEELGCNSNGEHKLYDPKNVVFEMAKRGRLPVPDRVMSKPAVSDEKSLNLNYDDQCILIGDGDDAQRRYKLYHQNPMRNITVELEFCAKTNPVLHGENGFVNDMFYYYYPSMDVRGKVKIGDNVIEVKGDGWYDREYGGSDDDVGRNALDGWTWLSLHLSNDHQLSLFDIVNSKTGEKKEHLVVMTSKGKREISHEVYIEESNWWTSLVTFSKYPLKYHIDVPSFELSLDIHAAFNYQEFPTVVVSGGFYEGRMIGEGYHKGSPVTVIGFCEHKKKDGGGDVLAILKNVGQYVQKTLSEFYPLQASDEWVAKNVFGRYCTGKGALAQNVCDTLFRPVRSIIDRGGKAWRSLVLVSSCNALSQDYFDCTRYIAIAELLHVGSLIIDDIQDDSSVRRGGKTAHLEYGISTAINAGTACYFMGVLFAEVRSLPIEKANRIYELYFDVMRAGHAGQGLDICGLSHLMPEVVRTGNSKSLEDALQAIHTYKTGCVSAAMCRVACILCDANEEVTSAMEEFGLGLGLAFQVVDDALNVKGFEGNLKEAGEDIRDGKITYPVAKAMGRLKLPERERVWTILQERTSDSDKIREVAILLNSVNAVDDCLAEARQLVEEKWEVIDHLIPDSIPKIMMRAFCLFLTERNF